MPIHAMTKTAAFFGFAILFCSSSQAAEVGCFPLNSLEPWNQPAPTELHPKSSEYSAMLWDKGGDRPGNINISPDYAVYSSADANETYKVDSTFGNMDGKSLRFNKSWRSYNSDGQIIVLAPDTRFTYEFYAAGVHPSTKSISAQRGDYLMVDDMSIYGRGGDPDSRGIGIPYVSMLVLDCEIMAGKINHALSLRVAGPKCHEAWWPATRIENNSDCTSNGIPEGARFVMRFSPNRVDAWAEHLRRKGGQPLEQFGRALAEALQVYGLFITDNGGSAASLDIQHTATWVNANPLKSYALSKPDAVRDILDGLINKSDIRLIAEQGPRLVD